MEMQRATESNPLAKLELASRMLAESTDLHEVKALMDMAKAAKAWARARKLGAESVKYAMKIENTAMLRLGELLKGIELSKGGRPEKTGTNSEPVLQLKPASPTLADLGLTKKDSSAAQKLCDAPATVRAAFESGEASKNEALREVKSAARAEKAAARAAKDRPVVKPLAYVSKADAVQFLGSVDRGSVDLLITDPPYMTDVPDIYAFSTRWLHPALETLKSTGRAYIFTGAYPQEIHAYLCALDENRALDGDGFTVELLTWTYRNAIGPAPKMGYRLNWHACFYLYGPDAAPLDCPELNERFSVQDVSAPDGRTGVRYHAWEKPEKLAERLIRHSTKSGDLIIDPFVGTGTFALVGARMGRLVVGCDVSQDMLDICKKRGITIQ